MLGHADEAVPQGHHRQEADHALPAAPHEGQAAQHGCPEAISMAILGHSTNTVAANYGSGYALEVMREHMERVW